MQIKQSAFVIAVLLGSASTKHHKKHHHSVHHDKKHDIAETHIDPWVFDKANPNVDRLTNPRTDTPPKRSSYTPPIPGPQPGVKATSEGGIPEIMGAANLYSKPTRKNERDIAETHIDPWVFDKA